MLLHYYGLFYFDVICSTYSFQLRKKWERINVPIHWRLGNLKKTCQHLNVPMFEQLEFKHWHSKVGARQPERADV